MAFVYKISNQIDGKFYIGVTTQKPMRRFSAHVREAQKGISQTYLHRAIRKHGKVSFALDILEECDSSVLYEREKHWISKLGCLAPSGYNEHAGGRGGSLNATDELRAKLSKAKKGRTTWNKGLTKADPRVAANCAAMSKALKGRVFSDQHKAAISAAKKKKQVDSVATDNLQTAEELGR